MGIEVGRGRRGHGPFFDLLVLAPMPDTGDASPGKGGVSHGGKENCGCRGNLGLRSWTSDPFGSIWSHCLMIITKEAGLHASAALRSAPE